MARERGILYRRAFALEVRNIHIFSKLQGEMSRGPLCVTIAFRIKNLGMVYMGRAAQRVPLFLFLSCFFVRTVNKPLQRVAVT